MMTDGKNRVRSTSGREATLSTHEDTPQPAAPTGVVRLHVNEPECSWTPKTLEARCSSTVQSPCAPLNCPVPLSMSRW